MQHTPKHYYAQPSSWHYRNYFSEKNDKGEWEEEDKLKKKEGLGMGELEGLSTGELEEKGLSTGELQFAPTAAIIKNLDFKIWQRNYYEHIIRNEKAYHRIAEYIMNNPKKWKEDKFY